MTLWRMRPESPLSPPLLPLPPLPSEPEMPPGPSTGGVRLDDDELQDNKMQASSSKSVRLEKRANLMSDPRYQISEYNTAGPG